MTRYSFIKDDVLVLTSNKENALAASMYDQVISHTLTTPVREGGMLIEYVGSVAEADYLALLADNAALPSNPEDDRDFLVSTTGSDVTVKINDVNVTLVHPTVDENLLTYNTNIQDLLFNAQLQEIVKAGDLTVTFLGNPITNFNPYEISQVLSAKGLSETLLIGNTTSGNNIHLSTGDNFEVGNANNYFNVGGSGEFDFYTNKVHTFWNNDGHVDLANKGKIQAVDSLSNKEIIINPEGGAISHNGGGLTQSLDFDSGQTVSTNHTLPLTSGRLLNENDTASTTVAGIVERATQSEVDAGTDTTRYVTPSTLSNYPGLGFLNGSTISPPQIIADQNNYTPTGWAGASTVRLDLDANHDITGFGAGSDGDTKYIVNTTTGATAKLKHDSGLSSASNRIYCPDGADHDLSKYSTVLIRYDGISNRWRVVGAKN